MCDLEALLLLLPWLATVDVMSVADVEGTLVIAGANHAGLAQSANCDPVLGVGTQRRVAHEAVGGRPVIDLTVRRLYCEYPGCSRAKFAEQVTRLTRATSGVPLRCTKMVDAVALSGRAGARRDRSAGGDEHRHGEDEGTRSVGSFQISEPCFGVIAGKNATGYDRLDGGCGERRGRGGRVGENDWEHMD